MAYLKSEKLEQWLAETQRELKFQPFIKIRWKDMVEMIPSEVVQRYDYLDGVTRTYGMTCSIGEHEDFATFRPNKDAQPIASQWTYKTITLDGDVFAEIRAKYSHFRERQGMGVGPCYEASLDGETWKDIGDELHDAHLAYVKHRVRFVGGPLDGQRKQMSRTEMQDIWPMPVYAPSLVAYGLIEDFDPSKYRQSYLRIVYKLSRSDNGGFRYVIENDEEWAQWKCENPPAAEASRQIVFDQWLKAVESLGVTPALDLPTGRLELYLDTTRCEFSIPRKRESKTGCVIEIRRLIDGR